MTATIDPPFRCPTVYYAKTVRLRAGGFHRRVLVVKTAAGVALAKVLDPHTDLPRWVRFTGPARDADVTDYWFPQI